MQNLGSFVSLIVWIIICFGAGAFGSRYMPGPWFEQLRKPGWNPPNWVFAPVWTTLYLMMAIAVWRVWQKGTWTEHRLPIFLFLAQLLLNALWTYLFFGLKKPGLAFADIAVLWVLLLATVIAFWGVRQEAGWLLIPYLAWVTFASALNFSIWRLNV